MADTGWSRIAQMKTRRPPPVKPGASPRRDANRHTTLPLHGWNCLGLDRETRSARLAKRNKPLQSLDLDTSRDQKSPLRRCFKLRPPRSTGFTGRLRLPIVVRDSTACTASGDHYRDPCSSLATVQPLVWMSTDRHAATGTCEIGQSRIKRDAPSMQEFFCPPENFFGRAGHNGYADVVDARRERLAFCLDVLRRRS